MASDALSLRHTVEAERSIRYGGQSASASKSSPSPSQVPARLRFQLPGAVLSEVNDLWKFIDCNSSRQVCELKTNNIPSYLSSSNNSTMPHSRIHTMWPIMIGGESGTGLLWLLYLCIYRYNKQVSQQAYANYANVNFHKLWLIASNYICIPIMLNSRECLNGSVKSRFV